MSVSATKMAKRMRPRPAISIERRRRKSPAPSGSKLDRMASREAPAILTLLSSNRFEHRGHARQCSLSGFQIVNESHTDIRFADIAAVGVGLGDVAARQHLDAGLLPQPFGRSFAV